MVQQTFHSCESYEEGNKRIDTLNNSILIKKADDSYHLPYLWFIILHFKF